MKKSVLVFITFLLGAISAFGQAYVSFAEKPKMNLSTQNQYSNYRIKYKAVKKSTIYLELKKGDLIVASGVLDVPRASESTANITIKVKSQKPLPSGSNYSYNLYMYSGGRNDWSNKACKSESVKGVSMSSNKSSSNKKSKNSMSLRSFFN